METYKIDAVLLAGGRQASVAVRNDNKAFLLLNHIPLFVHVLRALLDARHIRNVVVIGPAERLQSELDNHQIQSSEGSQVIVVEQRENMIENFKTGFVATLGADPAIPFESLRGSHFDETPVLVVPSDIPLLTAAEVDEFIARSNMHEYDYSIGVTSSEVMSHYHPDGNRAGVKMIYFHVKEDLFRHNNLHIGKPLKFEHLDYIEKMYEWRYQTRFANIVRMLFSLLFEGWRLTKGLRTFILLQLSLYYDRHGHPKLSHRVRSLVGINRLAEGIGNAIGAHVEIVYTHFGGAALDADNERDLSVIEERYDEWMEHQNNLVI